MPTRNELAKIHIAKKALQLTDDLYRNFLNLMFGKESAKELSPAEVEELLFHFQSLGWRPHPPGSGAEANRSPSSGPVRPKPHRASRGQVKFLEALWMTGNGVHRKNREALEHFLRHHFHLPDLDSVPADQVGAIAGAIKKIAAGPDAVPRS